LLVFHLEQVRQSQYQIPGKVGLMATLAGVKYSTAFICTPQLLRVEPHFFSAAFFAGLARYRLCVQVFSRQGLNF
jgi:hypothetical protein